ncbi:MAG: hypothetical protein AAFP77_26525 [Bacteroidota bacterium]
MLATLNIVLGLIFVLLLFSLLTSTVMEVIASALSLRGKHLENFLRTMMVEHFENFKRHPLFKQISNATTGKNQKATYQMPSWINRDTFTAIVGDMLDVKDPELLKKRIADLEEGDVKSMLQFLLRRTGGDPEAFVKEMEYWFDEMMERASSWYRDKMKWWLFAVGLTLATIFNVDTIKTYQTISKSTTIQNFLAEAATQFEAQTDTIGGINFDKSIEESLDDLDASLQRFEELKSPLGLGWDESETGEQNLPWWLVKALGLLLTGIAVTFGAPFWFDLLKKILSIRSTVTGGATPAANATGSEAPAESGSAAEPPTSLTAPRGLEDPIGHDPNAPKIAPQGDKNEE